jgi:uncharacterized protein
MTIDDKTRTELEAAVFRRLVEHLRSRSDVQNIDLMNLAGFCRNCLSNWLKEEADARGAEMSKDESREAVYGMPYETWKSTFQGKASPEQLAAMKKAHSGHWSSAFRFCLRFFFAFILQLRQACPGRHVLNAGKKKGGCPGQAGHWRVSLSVALLFSPVGALWMSAMLPWRKAPHSWGSSWDAVRGKRAALPLSASTVSSIQEYPMATTAAAVKEAPATKFAKDQLKAIIERIERLEEEKKTISDDIRDVYAEAKGNGFDVKALRTIVRLRKQDANERAEQETILETYLQALGMVWALAGRHGNGVAAAAHAAEVLKREPKFSVALYLGTQHYKLDVDRQRHEAGLLKAGLPAWPAPSGKVWKQDRWGDSA